MVSPAVCRPPTHTAAGVCMGICTPVSSKALHSFVDLGMGLHAHAHLDTWDRLCGDPKVLFCPPPLTLFVL